LTCGQAHRSAARARPGALARLRREAGQHAGRVLFSMTGSAASWFGAPSGGATSSCSSAKSSSSVAMAAQTPSAPRPELVTQPESWGRHIVSPISSARNDSMMMGNRRNDKPLTQSRTNYFQGQIFRRGGRRDGHCAVRARGPADRRHFGRQGAPGARAHTSFARGGQSAQARTRAVRCGHRCCRACVRACVRARCVRRRPAPGLPCRTSEQFLTARGGQFAPEHNLLLVSSWNAEVRMYDVLVIEPSHPLRRPRPLPACRRRQCALVPSETLAYGSPPGECAARHVLAQGGGTRRVLGRGPGDPLPGPIAAPSRLPSCRPDPPLAPTAAGWPADVVPSFSTAPHLS